jgi:hypothetical protein
MYDKMSVDIMMRQTSEIAYILKRFLPSQQKLSILTPTQGKCNLIVKKLSLCTRLWPGMLISFRPQLTHNNTIMSDDIQILYTPEGSVPHDIYWLHHLLELFYYFIPQASPDREVFDYLSCYISILDYKENLQENLALLKKICIIHFLQTTGSATSGFGFDDKHFLTRISHLPIQLAMHKEVNQINNDLNQINKADSEKINTWILQNLKIHPCFMLFKTIRFIYPS